MGKLIDFFRRGIKCDSCGRKFFLGNDENGIPNGVGFILEDGSRYNVCSDCIMELGENAEEHGN